MDWAGGWEVVRRVLVVATEVVARVGASFVTVAQRLSPAGPHGKSAVRLNMDDTTVCLFQGGGRGSIFDVDGLRACQSVSRDKTRRNITHIAFICDDPAIQRVLPQVLVANEHTFLVRDNAALLGGVPPNVTLQRRKSAWNNKAMRAGDLHAARCTGAIRSRVSAYARARRGALPHCTLRVVCMCSRGHLGILGTRQGHVAATAAGHTRVPRLQGPPASRVPGRSPPLCRWGDEPPRAGALRLSRRA